jgi:hypothetical protein
MQQDAHLQYYENVMFSLFTEISTPNINYPGLVWDRSRGTVSHEHGLIFIMLVARLTSLVYCGRYLVHGIFCINILALG